jgi:NAD(P)-dependent dehydrogenase (short-subunit alcohol dehydrogenase family)
MTRFKDKTVLITGGTTGIGWATAKLLLQEGARVAITGQDEQRVLDAKQSLGGEVVALRADVSSASDMAAVATRLKAEFGGLDIVFANAGIARPMPIGDVDEANIDDQVNVNFKGVIYTVQKMLPLLRNPSSIVLTSSTMAEKGIGGMGVYAATKAAVRSLARTLSAELVGRGIRVNAVSPGLTETPIYSKLGMNPDAVQAWAGQLVSGVPMKRFARADEVARAVAFLASEDSAYMLGENVLVDGGVATL